MTKVVVAMSMSLDGIAGPQSADADGMAIFTAILGWQFPLRSWRRGTGHGRRGGFGGLPGVGGQLRPVRSAGHRPDDVRFRLSELGREPTVPRTRVRRDSSRQERISKSGGLAIRS